MRTLVLRAMLGAAGGFLSRPLRTIWPSLIVVAIECDRGRSFLTECKGQIGLITVLAAIIAALLAVLATLERVASRRSAKRLVSIEDVGATVAVFVTDMPS